MEGKRLFDFLSAGGRVGLITGPDRSGTTALLDEITAAFSGTVYKVANPLVTPLNLTRIMVQVDASDDGGDDVALLGAHLAASASLHEPSMLAVDDAHTLDDDALAAMAQLAAPAGSDARLLVLLAGRPALLARAAATGLDTAADPARVLAVSLHPLDPITPAIEPSRPQPPANALPAVPPPPPMLTAPVLDPAPTPDSPERPAAVPLPAHVQAPEPEIPPPAEPNPSPQPQPQPRKPARRLPLMAMLALAGLIGLGVTLALRRDPRTPPPPAPATTPAPVATPAAPPGPNPATPIPPRQTTPLPTPEPAPQPAPTPQKAPDPSPAAPATEPPAAAPAPPETTTEPPAPRAMSKTDDQLRREFRSFLIRSGRSTLMQDPAKFEELFQEYLRWKSREQPD